MDSIIVAFGVLVVIIVVLAIFFSFFPVGLWISALASGVKIRISTLVGMRIRRITPSRLVYPLIKATKAGLDVSIDKMEAHYLAGGNIDRVINALIAAQRADIDLVFERAAAIDLAGRDVLQAVQMSVNPKVIETPVVAAIAIGMDFVLSWFALALGFGFSAAVGMFKSVINFAMLLIADRVVKLLGGGGLFA